MKQFHVDCLRAYENSVKNLNFDKSLSQCIDPSFLSKKSYTKNISFLTQLLYKKIFLMSFHLSTNTQAGMRTKLALRHNVNPKNRRKIVNLLLPRVVKIVKLLENCHYSFYMIGPNNPILTKFNE